MEKPLVFALNGERVEVAQPDPSMTLLTYIRTFTRFKGTKLGCGEGGCGACVVHLAKYDPVSKQVEESTINSCLALLCSFHLCAITTTEGLAASGHGLHAVHRRISGFHGSQCGFCTPGVTMALYGTLRQAGCASAAAAAAAGGGCGLSAAKAERAVQGNICRCTGYRPILDTCKSFAADVDLEDLGLNSFWPSKDHASPALLPEYHRSKDPEFPQFLIAAHEEEALSSSWEGTRFLDGGVAERVWVAVHSLEELFRELGKHQGSSSGKEVKLVAGNTSAGIFKDVRPAVFIDITGVPALVAVRHGSSELEVGSAVSLSKFITALEENRSSEVHTALAAHLERLASVHVRNRGSVGGNLILAQQLAFDSDLATILLGAGASVKVAGSGGKNVVLSIDQFLEKGALEPGTVLLSVVVPSWVVADQKSGSSNGSSDEVATVFKTYRASGRPLGNAVSYVNSAFLAQLVTRAQGGHLVQQLRLAFGAFGSKHAVLASEVEEVLTGKVLTPKLLLEAIEVLKATVVPAKGTHKAAYRASVLVGHLFEFFRPFLGTTPVEGTLENGANGSSSANGSLENGHSNGTTKATKSKALTTGTQKIAVSEEFFPVGKPTAKVVAELQASGEAVYVDDIPSPPGCLHAAFFLSDKIFADVKNIDASRALATPGAVSLVTAADIPEGGQNIGVSLYGVDEPFLAVEQVEYYGHPLGVVVADTAQHAKEAAQKVDVTYDTKSVGPPILSVEDAVANNSYFDTHPMVVPLIVPVGDVEEGFSQAELKIENAEVSCGHQYHFYMEMQSVLVVPDEDGQVVVYSACQGTEYVQAVVAKCLGIPLHNVRVVTRRVGGGFGGKITKATIVAAACALAAWKLKRPVRMYLDRRTDMLIVGGRAPMQAVYSAGFKKDGKIVALKTKVFLDAGHQPDFTITLPFLVNSSIMKYDWGAFAGEYKVLKTNSRSSTALRAPGDVQGSFIAETVIEHVAATLGISAQEVRDKNMHSVESACKFYSPTSVGGAEGFTLPAIWEQLKASSHLEERTREIELFNEKSKWRKRGLSMIPAVHGISVWPTVARVTVFSDGSVVVEVGGIEMGQGLWTKVRQAAAYGLSHLCQVDTSKIRIVQADSISLGNGGMTGGSSTSEGNSLAVLEACKLLVERLKPIKSKLEEAHPNGGSWEAIVGMAKMIGVDLSSQTSSIADPHASQYVTFGAAVSEVEIDVLTGETVTLRSDVLYDCGKSLNPVVDVGQVEGAFVLGMGFFLTEQIQHDEEGRQVTEGTWLYKPPTLDNIPRIFNVELLNSAPHRVRILSSKASGEPPLLLAASVHCAVRGAISAAKQGIYGKSEFFRLDSSASIDKVKTHCGLDNVEHHLSSLISPKVLAR